jgi:hypothetical protein
LRLGWRGEIRQNCLVRLAEPFLKLPIRFDAEALKREIQALPKSAWVPHATGFPGNEAVRLITVGGEETDDFNGQMAPTEYLRACPYIMEIMAELDGVWGRSRLMGLGAGAEVPLHVDSHYYWRTHWRIHVPIITSPAVSFSCGPETVHMQAGHCWMFDSFRWHRVLNGGTEQRVHLVLDTVATERLRHLMAQARSGHSEATWLEPGHGPERALKFERVNYPKVMTPWEIREHLGFLAQNAVPHPLLQPVFARLEEFASEWGAAWAQYGTDDDGLPAFRQLIERAKGDLTAINGGGRLVLNNQVHLYLALENLIFVSALDQPQPARHDTASAAA